MNNLKSNALIKWTGIVTVLLLLSRITGFFRETAIAYRFGTSAETDAYLIAAMLPQILFYAFSDAVRTAFIPVYGEYRESEECNAFALTSYVILGGMLLVFSVLLVYFAPVVVRLAAPGFTGATYRQTVVMSRILLPGLLFMGLSGLSSGILHANKNFIIPALPAYPSNLLIIFFSYLSGATFGIEALAWVTLIGFAGQFFIQVPAVAKLGVFKSRKLLWHHPGLRKMSILLPPVILGGAALELKSIVDRVFASLLPEGSIAALNFAARIYLLPHGILIVALLSVLYPTMVEMGVEKNITALKKTIRHGLGLITLAVFPMMVGLIVLSTPIVRILFERGAFDAAATQSTAFALTFYSLGLVAIGAQALLSRAFYALSDTITPMIVTFFLVIANAVFNWLLLKPLQHGGIALGTSLAFNLGLLVLFCLLRRKIGPFGGREILATLWKSALAAAIMGIFLFFGKGYLVSTGLRLAMELGALIGLGSLVYFSMAWLLKISELKLACNVLRKKLK